MNDAEAISFFTSGRDYIAAGDIDTGISQLKQSIRRGGRGLDQREVYGRLCLLTIGTDEGEKYLQEGLKRFPDEGNLNLYRMVLNSFDSGDRSYERLKKADGETLKMIGRAYYNMIFRLKESHPERAELALQRAYEFYPELFKGENKGD